MQRDFQNLRTIKNIRLSAAIAALIMPLAALADLCGCEERRRGDGLRGPMMRAGCLVR